MMHFLDLGQNNEVLQFAKVFTVTRQDMFKASRFRFKGDLIPDCQSSSVSDSIELLVYSGLNVRNQDALYSQPCVIFFS